MHIDLRHFLRSLSMFGHFLQALRLGSLQALLSWFVMTSRLVVPYLFVSRPVEDAATQPKVIGWASLFLASVKFFDARISYPISCSGLFAYSYSDVTISDDNAALIWAPGSVMLVLAGVLLNRFWVVVVGSLIGSRSLLRGAPPWWKMAVTEEGVFLEDGHVVFSFTRHGGCVGLRRRVPVIGMG